MRLISSLMLAHSTVTQKNAMPQKRGLIYCFEKWAIRKINKNIGLYVRRSNVCRPLLFDSRNHFDFRGLKKLGLKKAGLCMLYKCIVELVADARLRFYAK